MTPRHAHTTTQTPRQTRPTCLVTVILAFPLIGTVLVHAELLEIVEAKVGIAFFELGRAFLATRQDGLKVFLRRLRTRVEGGAREGVVSVLGVAAHVCVCVKGRGETYVWPFLKMSSAPWRIISINSPLEGATTHTHT